MSVMYFRKCQFKFTFKSKADGKESIWWVFTWRGLTVGSCVPLDEFFIQRRVVSLNCDDFTKSLDGNIFVHSFMCCTVASKHRWCQKQEENCVIYKTLVFKRWKVLLCFCVIVKLRYIHGIDPSGLKISCRGCFHIVLLV